MRFLALALLAICSGCTPPGECEGVGDYTPCGPGDCATSGTISNHYCLRGACTVIAQDCCGGCSPALAPGCWMKDDGTAACGCFTQGGGFCR